MRTSHSSWGENTVSVLNYCKIWRLKTTMICYFSWLRVDRVSHPVMFHMSVWSLMWLHLAGSQAEFQQGMSKKAVVLFHMALITQ